MFNQSNSSFQIWWILSQVWLNSAKEWVSFISNSYIKIAWTLTSAIFPKNFLFQTCEGWWLRFLATLLLVHLGMSCTFDYSCSFQTPPLAPQWTLQPCLLKSTFAEISRCGSEFLPATRVPQRFAGWRCLTGHTCSVTLSPLKLPQVPQSPFSKLFREQQPLTSSLKPY